MTRPDPYSFLVVDDARWSCSSCGSCCRHFALGPVEPEVIEDLRARDIGSLWPPAADGWCELRASPDGSTAWFLHDREGGCVFLRDDSRCAIHALLGAEAKPAFCREFPIHLVDEPRGTAAVVRADCAGLHHTYLDGEPVVDQAPGVAALARQVPRARFEPELVEVFQEARVPLDTWLEWEDDLRALARAEVRAPREAVAALRRDLAGRSAVVLPDPDPDRYLLALRACLEALRLLMGHVLAHPDPTAPPHRVRFAADMAALVDRAVAGVHQPAGLDEGALDYLHLLLRHALLGRAWGATGAFDTGMGLWLLGIELGRAARSGGGPLDAEGLAAVHVPWTRLAAIPAVHQVLLKARPALRDLFLHACGPGGAG